MKFFGGSLDGRNEVYKLSHLTMYGGLFIGRSRLSSLR